MKLRHIRLTLALLPVAALLQAQLARPLPLFSRASNSTCGQCHMASSQLTVAGATYAIDGSRSAADTVSDALRFPVSVVASAGASASREGSASNGPSSNEFDVLDNRSAALHAQLRFGDLASVRLEANAGQPPSLRQRSLCYAQIGAVSANRSLLARVGRFDAALPLLSNRWNATIHPYLSPVGLDALGLSLTARRGGWAGGGGLIDSRQDLRPSDRAPLAIRRLNDAYLWAHRGGEHAAVEGSFLFDRQNSTLTSLTWMQHLKAEVGAEFSVRRLMLVPGYVFDRYDDRPAAGIHEHHQYYLIEALAPLDARSRWLLAGRYEHDYRTPTVLTPEVDRQLGVANLSCEILPGTTLGVEGSDARDNVGGPEVRSVDARIRLVY